MSKAGAGKRYMYIDSIVAEQGCRWLVQKGCHELHRVSLSAEDLRSTSRKTDVDVLQPISDCTRVVLMLMSMVSAGEERGAELLHASAANIS